MERWLRMTRQSGLEFARGSLPEMRAGSQDRAIGRVLERQDPALVSLKGTSSLPVLTSERQTPFRKLLPTRVLPSGAKATELKCMRSAANRCSPCPWRVPRDESWSLCCPTQATCRRVTKDWK